MLLPNVVIHAVYTTLENGKVAFDCVRRDANTVLVSDVFLRLMIHAVMLVRGQSARENTGAIRHYVRSLSNHVSHDSAKILSRHLRHMDGLHAAPTLQHRHDWGLIRERADAILCSLSRLYLIGLRMTALSANVRFINFDNPRELR